LAPICLIGRHTVRHGGHPSSGHVLEGSRLGAMRQSIKQSHTLNVVSGHANLPSAMCLIYGSTHAHDEPPPHYLGRAAITIDGEGGATRLTAGLLPTDCVDTTCGYTLLDATNRLVGVVAWDFDGTPDDSLGSECRYRLAGHDSASPSEHAPSSPDRLIKCEHQFTTRRRWGQLQAQGTVALCEPRIISDADGTTGPVSTRPRSKQMRPCLEGITLNTQCTTH
jgi:hypothetical protein